jgi:hypothetical protein
MASAVYVDKYGNEYEAGGGGWPPDDVTIEINDDDELQIKDGGVSTPRYYRFN